MNERLCLDAREKRCTRMRAGFTLLELLVLVAVLGVIAVGVFVFLPDDANRTAEDMARAFQQARFEAVKREVPVAVVWDDGADAIRIWVNAADCEDSGVLLRTLDLSDRRVETISVGVPGGGLIWLPSNFARDCGNDALFVGTTADAGIVVSGRRIERNVEITAAGLVTVR